MALSRALVEAQEEGLAVPLGLAPALLLPWALLPEAEREGVRVREGVALLLPVPPASPAAVPEDWGVALGQAQGVLVREAVAQGLEVRVAAAAVGVAPVPGEGEKEGVAEALGLREEERE